jgi:regulator of sigma E protease
LSWLLVIAGFAFLIIIHEAGHFIAAKATGMRVEKFFLFFPPKLVSVRRGETEYGIGTIPLGGYVKITGMNPDEVREASDETGEEGAPRRGLASAIASGEPPEGDRVEPLPPEVAARAYYRQPVWKRIVVIGAGPAMNILLAFAIFFVLAFGLQEGTFLKVSRIEGNTPAQHILQKGDRLISIDGVPAKSGDLQSQSLKLSDQINSHQCAGKTTPHCRATTPVRIVLRRGDRTLAVSAKPFYDPNVDRFRLGFAFAEGGLHPVNPSVWGAVSRSATFMWTISSKTVSAIARIFEPQQRKQLSGVVGVSDVAHQAIGFGAREALTLLAIISLSLALINLFPFLPLDGGHIFWSLVEKVRGAPVPFRIMERAGAIGFVLVILLFFIGLTNDIGRLSGNGFHVR